MTRSQSWGEEGENGRGSMKITERWRISRMPTVTPLPTATPFSEATRLPPATPLPPAIPCLPSPYIPRFAPIHLHRHLAYSSCSSSYLISSSP